MKQQTSLVRKALHCLIALATTFAIFLLSGCLDYSEEIWLNSNESGRAEIIVKLPPETAASWLPLLKAFGGNRPFPELAASKWGGIPGIKLVRAEETKQGDTLIWTINVEFEQFDKFIRWMDEESLASAGGKASFSSDVFFGKENGSLAYRRIKKATQPMDGNALLGVALLGMSDDKSPLASHYFTYRVHFPNRVISTNGRITDKSERVVEWKSSFLSVSTGMEMRALLKPSIWQHLWGWTLAACAVGVGIGVVRRLSRPRRRRRICTPLSTNRRG